MNIIYKNPKSKEMSIETSAAFSVMDLAEKLATMVSYSNAAIELLKPTNRNGCYDFEGIVLPAKLYIFHRN